MITPSNSIHILWLIPQYVVMTMGEVMFSVTGLEFSFTQAPASMKSVLQSVWLLTVAFGNLIVVLIVEGNFLDAQVRFSTCIYYIFRIGMICTSIAQNACFLNFRIGKIIGSLLSVCQDHFIRNLRRYQTEININTRSAIPCLFLRSISFYVCELWLENWKAMEISNGMVQDKKSYGILSAA